MYKDSNGKIITKPLKVVVEGVEIHAPSDATLAKLGIDPYVPPTPEPLPPPPPSYSVEEIIYGLIEANALQAVKQIVGDYWELFTMRDVIASDNEIWAAKFPALKAAIVASGALTEAEITAILTEAEV